MTSYRAGEIFKFEMCQSATRHSVYLGSFSLDPEDFKSLSLGVIWNFSKGTGLPRTDIRLLTPYSMLQIPS